MHMGGNDYVMGGNGYVMGGNGHVMVKMVMLWGEW